MSPGRRDPTKPREYCRKCGGLGYLRGETQSRGLATRTECPRCGGSGLEPENELTNEQQSFIGGGAGAAVGYAMGGPAGAVVGGLIGIILSKEEGNDDEI